MPDTSVSSATIASPAAEIEHPQYVLGYWPAIDGVRGLMPVGVLVSHLNYEWFPGAIVFLNIFFMLSAYLITSLLLRDIRRYGKIRFRNFYIRRTLRLFPANYAMIILMTIVAIFLMPDVKGYLYQSLVAALYISNWTRAFQVPMPEWLGHTWSLSIEEQYYLLWPLLLTLLVRFFGVSRRAVAVVLGLALCSALWRFWLERNGVSHIRLYNGTDTRADTLLIGCALAMLISFQGFRTHPLVLKISRHALLPLTLILFIVLGLTLHWTWRGLYSWGSLLEDMMIAVFLSGLLLHHGTLVHRFFENKALVFLGRMSYSTYLLHFPIFWIMRERFHADVWTIAVFGFAMTYAISYLFFRYIETPCLNLKVKFH